MFTLRIVQPRHTENIFLGRSYALITEKDNPQTYKEIIDAGTYASNNIFAFLHSDTENEEHALLKEYIYYIVGSNGKTFQKISFR